MNRAEHLFLILGEEGVEVAQRVSKLLRFGADEVQPGQPLTNRERLVGEMLDLLALAGMLVEEGELPPDWGQDREAIAAKRAEVEHFLLYSREQGTLT